MGTVSSMLETYPRGLGRIDRAKLIRCIETCIECAQACTACADADLSEERVAHLTKCIRTNLDCDDMCVTTSRVLLSLATFMGPFELSFATVMGPPGCQ
jgi:hypothetical protein